MSTAHDGEEEEPIEPHLLAMKEELQTELSRLKSQGLATTATDQALELAASQLCTSVQHMLNLDAVHEESEFALRDAREALLRAQEEARRWQDEAGRLRDELEAFKAKEVWVQEEI